MYINIPGLGNSDPKHWQSIWERDFPEEFSRIQQENWRQPDCSIWIDTLARELRGYDLSESILIGHSIGCAAIIHWFVKYGRSIKGALLVAPSDPDQQDYPKYITGFSPIPILKLPFPSIVVASTNDHVVTVDRAQYFADCWGSEFMVLPDAGHIETKSGFGKWDSGLELLQKFK